MKDYVDSSLFKHLPRVNFTAVEKVGNYDFHLLRSFTLRCINPINFHEHGTTNRSFIVKKCSDNMLVYEFILCQMEWWLVFLFCMLIVISLSWIAPWEQFILQLQWNFVMEILQHMECVIITWGSKIYPYLLIPDVE